jgi:hypothetical protein
MNSPNRPMRLAVVVGAATALLTGCGPSSTKADSPLIQEMGGMQKLIVKLRDYSETNSTPLIWNKVGTNVDALVEAGALSSADANYIRLHKLQFRGFDPARIGSDVTVFELVFTNSSNPTRRIIGHSDGSVAVRSHPASQ